ncbi:MAG: hypothetical protein OEV42_16755 [Deltaproteobacteria bacterium]|nr:hypothetical protein [Deltaproteobacteria bacterium]
MLRVSKAFEGCNHFEWPEIKYLFIAGRAFFEVFNKVAKMRSLVIK